MSPPGADQGRGHSHPHHGRRERGMRIGRVRIESQQIPVGLGSARGQRPCPQLAGPRQPLRRHGLDGAAGPLGRDADQTAVGGGADERGVLVGVADLRRAARRRRSSRRAPRRATPIDDHRQPRRLVRATANQDDLSGRSQDPGQVGDRRRHRLSREEGQLTHEHDTRSAIAFERAHRAVRIRTVAARTLRDPSSAFDRDLTIPRASSDRVVDTSLWNRRPSWRPSIPQEPRRHAVAPSCIDFGRELLACAVDGTAPDEHPLRHVADLEPQRARTQPWPQWADPAVVARVRRPRHHRALVASGSRRRRCPFGPPRGAQHRHRVGKVARLPTADPDRAGGRSAGTGAVPLADEGARARPAARRAVADGRRRTVSRDVAPAPTTATAAPRRGDSRARTRGGSSPTPT